LVKRWFFLYNIGSQGGKMEAVFFVLDDPEKLDQVIEALDEANIRGLTIIESTGIIRHLANRPTLPMRFSFPSASLDIERGNYTLFSVVENLSKVNEFIVAVESVVGNLDLPNTGIIATWKLDRVKGLPVQETVR
jgi:nitrogen regulatory protein P-II 1